MVGRKWARHTKSQQCLTTQAVLHPVDHLIKPITALHLHVLLHGRVQAILSAFRSMKLDVNLHFCASYINVTHCNEWEAIVEKKNWSHSVGVWARGQFVMWLHLSPSHWTEGKKSFKKTCLRVPFFYVLQLWYHLPSLKRSLCTTNASWVVMRLGT